MSGETDWADIARVGRSALREVWTDVSCENEDHLEQLDGHSSGFPMSALL
jgi:hypothetical protein